MPFLPPFFISKRNICKARTLLRKLKLVKKDTVNIIGDNKSIKFMKKKNDWINFNKKKFVYIHERKQLAWNGLGNITLIFFYPVNTGTVAHVPADARGRTCFADSLLSRSNTLYYWCNISINGATSFPGLHSGGRMGPSFSRFPIAHITDTDASK